MVAVIPVDFTDKNDVVIDIGNMMYIGMDI